MVQIPLRERRSPGWGWVVGLLVVAVIVWAAAKGDGPSTNAGALDSAGRLVERSGDTTGAVAAFVAFADSGEQIVTNRDHRYTADGIRRLASALEARKTTTDSAAGRMRQLADSLEETRATNNLHANLARRAFAAAARAFDGSAAVEVERAASAIDPERPLLDQMDRVTAFFEEARDALETDRSS